MSSEKMSSSARGAAIRGDKAVFSSCTWREASAPLLESGLAMLLYVRVISSCSVCASMRKEDVRLQHTLHLRYCIATGHDKLIIVLQFQTYKVPYPMVICEMRCQNYGCLESLVRSACFMSHGYLPFWSLYWDNNCIQMFLCMFEMTPNWHGTVSAGFICV